MAFNFLSGASDAVDVQIFRYLCMQSRTDKTVQFDFMIPPTVVFRNCPTIWYESVVVKNNNGRTEIEVRQKVGRDLELHKLWEYFSTETRSDCEVVAYFVNEPSPGGGHIQDEAAPPPQRRCSRRREEIYMETLRETQQAAPSVEYFSKEDLKAFLFSSETKKYGFLQKYIPARIGRSETLQAVWSPKMSFCVKRMNRRRIGDKSFPMAMRANTFDGDIANTTEHFVHPSSSAAVMRVVDTIIEHVSLAAPMLSIRRLVAYFRKDHNNTLWFLYTSSLRVADASEVRQSNAKIRQLPVRLLPQFGGGDVQRRLHPPGHGALLEKSKSMHPPMTPLRNTATPQELWTRIVATPGTPVIIAQEMAALRVGIAADELDDLLYRAASAYVGAGRKEFIAEDFEELEEAYAGACGGGDGDAADGAAAGDNPDPDTLRLTVPGSSTRRSNALANRDWRVADGILRVPEHLAAWLDAAAPPAGAAGATSPFLTVFPGFSLVLRILRFRRLRRSLVFALCYQPLQVEPTPGAGAGALVPAAAAGAAAVASPPHSSLSDRDSPPASRESSVVDSRRPSPVTTPRGAGGRERASFRSSTPTQLGAAAGGQTSFRGGKPIQGSMRPLRRAQGSADSHTGLRVHGSRRRMSVSASGRRLQKGGARHASASTTNNNNNNSFRSAKHHESPTTRPRRAQAVQQQPVVSPQSTVVSAGSAESPLRRRKFKAAGVVVTAVASRGSRSNSPDTPGATPLDLNDIILAKADHEPEPELHFTLGTGVPSLGDFLCPCRDLLTAVEDTAARRLAKAWRERRFSATYIMLLKDVQAPPEPLRRTRTKAKTKPRAHVKNARGHDEGLDAGGEEEGAANAAATDASTEDDEVEVDVGLQWAQRTFCEDREALARDAIAATEGLERDAVYTAAADAFGPPPTQPDEVSLPADPEPQGNDGASPPTTAPPTAPPSEGMEDMSPPVSRAGTERTLRRGASSEVDAASCSSPPSLPDAPQASPGAHPQPARKVSTPQSAVQRCGDEDNHAGSVAVDHTSPGAVVTDAPPPPPSADDPASDPAPASGSADGAAVVPAPAPEQLPRQGGGEDQSAPHPAEDASAERAAAAGGDVGGGAEAKVGGAPADAGGVEGDAVEEQPPSAGAAPAAGSAVGDVGRPEQEEEVNQKQEQAESPSEPNPANEMLSSSGAAPPAAGTPSVPPPATDPPPQPDTAPTATTAPTPAVPAPAPARGAPPAPAEVAASGRRQEEEPAGLESGADGALPMAAETAPAGVLQPAAGGGGREPEGKGASGPGSVDAAGAAPEQDERAGTAAAVPATTSEPDSEAYSDAFEQFETHDSAAHGDAPDAPTSPGVGTPYTPYGDDGGASASTPKPEPLPSAAADEDAGSVAAGAQGNAVSADAAAEQSAEGGRGGDALQNQVGTDAPVGSAADPPTAAALEGGSPAVEADTRTADVGSTEATADAAAAAAAPHSNERTGESRTAVGQEADGDTQEADPNAVSATTADGADDATQGVVADTETAAPSGAAVNDEGARDAPVDESEPQAAVFDAVRGVQDETNPEKATTDAGDDAGGVDVDGTAAPTEHDPSSSTVADGDAAVALTTAAAGTAGSGVREVVPSATAGAGPHAADPPDADNGGGSGAPPSEDQNDGGAAVNATVTEAPAAAPAPTAVEPTGDGPEEPPTTDEIPVVNTTSSHAPTVRDATPAPDSEGTAPVAEPAAGDVPTAVPPTSTSLPDEVETKSHPAGTAGVGASASNAGAAPDAAGDDDANNNVGDTGPQGEAAGGAREEPTSEEERVEIATRAEPGGGGGGDEGNEDDNDDDDDDDDVYSDGFEEFEGAAERGDAGEPPLSPILRAPTSDGHEDDDDGNSDASTTTPQPIAISRSRGGLEESYVSTEALSPEGVSFLSCYSSMRRSPAEPPREYQELSDGEEDDALAPPPAAAAAALPRHAPHHAPAEYSELPEDEP